jgi:N-acetylmuramoyl-L-alanine amidase
MAPLLRLDDQSLIQAVKAAPETRKAYSYVQRTQFFIGGEDLEARSKIIDQVNPDVVIDIHFDANKLDALQSGETAIEAFVPGGVRANETGSRTIRSLHLKHLLDVQRWNESVNLASSIVQEMSKSLGLPLQDTPDFLTSVRVKDGVYARNLYINRRNLNALMVYLECLHYDSVSEFSNLTVLDQNGSYHGSSFRYPKRLNSVVQGIRAGILKYFQNR